MSSVILSDGPCKAMVKEFSLLPTWIRDETTSLHDVFKPSLVSAALTLDHNLGHLIYETQLWKELGGVVSDDADTLTTFFHKQGVFSRHIYTYTYDKQMWSITPFSLNLHGRAIKDCASIVGDVCKHMLFSYIIKSGHWNIVALTAAPVLAALPLLLHVMETHSCLNSTPSVTSKSRLLPPVRQALEGSLLTEFEDQILTLEKGVARKRSLNGEKENTHSDPQPKKRRLNAHQCLPFQPSEVVSGEMTIILHSEAWHKHAQTLLVHSSEFRDSI
ncbi:hypothetical protein DFH08DRAFT_816156 [Mycena albidolilacea]|uniref:Uncharacterized protein n=1 Tax=Mycena albidolilacea TaxID=1033008 RepID=A0AAD6ZLF8_9AGAR|nr:hypothetical protein DFH08DRAFT_816156 [Mycena albidolilacea]